MTRSARFRSFYGIAAMLRRRRMFVAFAILLGGVSAGLGGIVYTVKREPEFYRQAPAPSEWDAREKSSRLLTRWQDLKNEILTRAEWGETFTTEELNCFFAENMNRRGGLCTVLPQGFHSPRVAINGDRLKLGFRYREGFWSTVLWVELKVWLVKNETNLIAVEVCELCAGGLSFGSQSILDMISESLRDSNVEVTWYRKQGKPVGLFRLYADQRQPAAQVMTLNVADGKIVVAGKSFRDQPQGAPVGVNTPMR